MIILESKLVNNEYLDGYFLTIPDLKQLVRDFQADCFDSFVSNDNAYIEYWLRKHEQIKTEK